MVASRRTRVAVVGPAGSPVSGTSIGPSMWPSSSARTGSAARRVPTLSTSAGRRIDSLGRNEASIPSAARNPPSSAKNPAHSTTSPRSKAAISRSTYGLSRSDRMSDTRDTRASPIRARRSASMDCRWASAWLTCAVTSTWMPTQCVTRPEPSRTGETETWFQNGARSLR